MHTMSQSLTQVFHLTPAAEKKTQVEKSTFRSHYPKITKNRSSRSFELRVHSNLAVLDKTACSNPVTGLNRYSFSGFIYTRAYGSSALQRSLPLHVVPLCNHLRES